MLAARVEQKNGMTNDDKNGVILDKESPIQAVCGKAACTDLCGGRSAMSVPTANKQRRPNHRPKRGMHY